MEIVANDHYDNYGSAVKRIKPKSSELILKQICLLIFSDNALNKCTIRDATAG